MIEKRSKLSFRFPFRSVSFRSVIPVFLGLSTPQKQAIYVISDPERRDASIIYYVNPMSSAIGRPGFVVVTGCGGVALRTA